MDHSYGSNILRDNTDSMAFNGINGGAAYPLPTHSYRHHQHAANPYAMPHQADGHSSSNFTAYLQNQLNPSVPHFLPTGNELRLYQHPASPSPPHTPMANGISPAQGSLERYVADTHIKHATEIAKIGYLAHQNQTELEQTKEIVGRDLQKLQCQLEQLQTQLAGRDETTQQLTVVKRGVNVLELEITPPEVMLQHFDKETVAQVYLEQVVVSERLVRKLRDDAEALMDDDKTPKQADHKLLDAPKISGLGNDSPIIVNGSNDLETPTHMPARRVQRDKSSHAVTIKAPGDDKPKHPGQVEDEASHDKSAAPAASGRAWQPLAVRTMPPPIDTPSTGPVKFSTEFLLTQLGGRCWSPGFWFIAEDSKIKSKSFWLLDGEYEPFLPSEPGQHGAKLTPFFNSTLSKPGHAPGEENYMNVPVFVMKEGDTEYTYFGQYSQLRFSDKIDFDRVMETVPEKVRKYWAEELSDKHRPEWVTRALMEHFWPRPTYEGPIPTDEMIDSPKSAASGGSSSSVPLEKHVQSALRDYAMELKAWEKETHIKACTLTFEAIEEAFGMADADMEPGLRLHWEYFQCVGYDQKFYETMVQKQGTEKAKVKTSSAGQPSVKLAAANAMRAAGPSKTATNKATASASDKSIMEFKSSEQQRAPPAPAKQAMPSNAVTAGYKPQTAIKSAPALPMTDTEAPKPWVSAARDTLQAAAAKPIATPKPTTAAPKPAEEPKKPADRKQTNHFDPATVKVARECQDAATKAGSGGGRGKKANGVSAGKEKRTRGGQKQRKKQEQKKLAWGKKRAALEEPIEDWDELERGRNGRNSRPGRSE